MKLSFCMPFFNAWAFLAQSLDSLLAQTHEDMEILVYDDGSQIELYSDIQEHYTRNPKIHWFRGEKRKGGAYARNFLNSKSIGDILVVCDAGDVYVKDRGQVIHDFFCDQPGKDIFYSDVQLMEGRGAPCGVQQAVKWDGTMKPPISHPTVAYRRRVIEEVKYCEDSPETDFYEFFMIDAWRDGFEFGFENKVLTIKADLSGSEYQRDVQKAKELKAKKYEEYEIKIPAEMV